MEFSNECALLQEVYQGSAMGTEAIRLLLPKVKNARFRSDLKTQCRQYQDTGAKAEQELGRLGQCPRELTGEQQAMLWLCLQGKTLMNRETSYLAKLMIQGSNMGILNLTGVLNSYGDSRDDPAQSQAEAQLAQQAKNPAADLARQTIVQEQNNIDRLKVYLQ